MPDSIRKTDYAVDPNGYPYSEMEIRGSQKIAVLTEDEIEKMRVVCKVSLANKYGREVLEAGAKLAKVGTTTDEIDRVVHDKAMGNSD